jgi:hypothetical protein
MWRSVFMGDVDRSVWCCLRQDDSRMKMMWYAIFQSLGLLPCLVGARGYICEVANDSRQTAIGPQSLPYYSDLKSVEYSVLCNTSLWIRSVAIMWSFKWSQLLVGGQTSLQVYRSGTSVARLESQQWLRGPFAPGQHDLQHHLQLSRLALRDSLLIALWIFARGSTSYLSAFFPSAPHGAFLLSGYISSTSLCDLKLSKQSSFQDDWLLQTLLWLRAMSFWFAHLVVRHAIEQVIVPHAADTWSRYVHVHHPHIHNNPVHWNNSSYHCSSNLNGLRFGGWATRRSPDTCYIRRLTLLAYSIHDLQSATRMKPVDWIG